MKRLHSARRRAGSANLERARLYAFPDGGVALDKGKTPDQREVYWSPTRTVDLYHFDAAYLSRLRARHPETLAHFGMYFTRLLTIRLRSKRIPGTGADDICQETLLRVLKRVDADEVREPEKFAPFVFAVCHNVILESVRDVWKTDDEEFELLDPTAGPEEAIRTEEMRKTVAWVLEQMPDRDRRILIAVFLDERDKGDICKEFGVNREYLRVLLHRALNNARKKLGEGPPS